MRHLLVPVRLLAAAMAAPRGALAAANLNCSSRKFVVAGIGVSGPPGTHNTKSGRRGTLLYCCLVILPIPFPFPSLLHDLAIASRPGPISHPL